MATLVLTVFAGGLVIGGLLGVLLDEVIDKLF